MILKDLHVHTTYCDGKNTPEEMVLSAIDKNMECIGFSAHSYTFFDERYCIKKEKIKDYIFEINSLKEKYKEKIRILCGIEQDAYSTYPTNIFDYVIGSVHYLKINDFYAELDGNANTFKNTAENYFNGDYYALAEEYFKTVGDMAEKLNPTFIGHLDLVTKFNKNFVFFDELNERYLKAKRAAVDKILNLDIPFEINLGGISRGYKTCPYPDIETIRYISNNGGKFLFSGDTHTKDNLCFDFEKWCDFFIENNIITLNSIIEI